MKPIVKQKLVSLYPSNLEDLQALTALWGTGSDSQTVRDLIAIGRAASLSPNAVRANQFRSVEGQLDLMEMIATMLHRTWKERGGANVEG